MVCFCSSVSFIVVCVDLCVDVFRFGERLIDEGVTQADEDEEEEELVLRSAEQDRGKVHHPDEDEQEAEDEFAFFHCSSVVRV